MIWSDIVGIVVVLSIIGAVVWVVLAEFGHVKGPFDLDYDAEVRYTGEKDTMWKRMTYEFTVTYRPTGESIIVTKKRDYDIYSNEKEWARGRCRQIRNEIKNGEHPSTKPFRL